MTSGDMFDFFSASQVSHSTSVSKDNLLFQVTASGSPTRARGTSSSG